MVKIQIKKSSLNRQVSDDLKVNLREEPKEEQKKQPCFTEKRKWLFFSAFLFLVVIVLIVSLWFSSFQKMAFADLIPENAVAFGLINQQKLYPQISPFSQFLYENNFYGQKAINKLSEYFNQAGLDFKENIQPFFKKQSVFILMPANSETYFPFIVILEGKIPLNDFIQVLSRIEQELKKDYNSSSYIYRQIKTTILTPLFSASSGLPNMYAYAQIENYFILSNSQESIEKIIDLIIEN